VRFGTSYFPYSTLGENFDSVKLPGMDRESFWPLAADTVTHWQLFADDIRRDLRLIKGMGFQLVRLHHLELLAPLEKKIRDEYLDFLFGELRHLKLKVLLDVYASPAQMTELLVRYGDAVDAVEIENETLIWGIPLDRPASWNDLYSAVKKVAPQVRVHFTGYSNTGMFDRLNALGVHYDRVCLHSYIDALDAMPSGRGYSLALSSYATKRGKPPLITEWNWRGLTRMSPEARAKIYPEIIESAIGTRGIPDFYQFQFNETLCPNPRLGRGNILRHYELFHLSRRPKAEAIQLQELIKKYSSAQDPLRKLTISFPIVYLDAKGQGVTEVWVKNNTKSPTTLGASVEAFGGLNCEVARRLTVAREGNGALEGAPELVDADHPASRMSLNPGEEKIFQVDASLAQRKPGARNAGSTNNAGFYHGFLRIESEDGLLRYATIEAEMGGAPSFDSDRVKCDWSRTTTVVFGKEAPVLEVETAIAIAETLEAAIGRPIEALQENDVPEWAKQKSNLVLVGTAQSLPLLSNLKVAADGTNGFYGSVSGAAGSEYVPVTGADSRAVENAGMNFILSYWKNAQASAARRVGLAAKELPRGLDAAKLP
ncbi:MAG TPA: hypothetical protein VLT36_25365, partial [Candidatus Dormibacteraeota bacterium]|nr:hypothetical protein [Candidatus Dormibacteraeota bacterium]